MSGVWLLDFRLSIENRREREREREREKERERGMKASTAERGSRRIKAIVMHKERHCARCIHHCEVDA